MLKHFQKMVSHCNQVNCQPSITRVLSLLVVSSATRTKQTQFLGFLETSIDEIWKVYKLTRA